MDAAPRTLSVIIPVRDRIESLRRALASALAQTAAPEEVVVVDDASATPVTEAAIGLDDPRIRILRLDSNRGAAGARMAGVSAARGEIVAFLDSDDVFRPGKLAAQLPLLAGAGDLVAVACGWEARDEATGQTTRRLPIPSADPLDFASGCWFSPGSTVLLPRQAFAICGPFDPDLRRLEDLDWFLRFALAGGVLRVAPVIGCTIAIGRRARPGPVFEAADRIERKFARSRDPGVTPALRRRLRAWLQVERAVALRNGGRPVGMAAAMLRSLVLVPRARLHLRRWWVDDPVG